MMRSRRREGKQKGRWPTSGLTLVELVIVVAIISVVLTGIYQIFLASYQSQAVVATDSNFIDNARRAVDAMARDLRVAGLDPLGNGIFGFNGCAAGPNCPGGFTSWATQAVVLPSLDQDRDGILDSNTLERVGFCLSSSGSGACTAGPLPRNVVRTMDGTNQAAGFPPVATNVTDLRFEYFTGADTLIPTTPAMTPAQRNTIRRIRITVTFSGTAGGLARDYQVTTDVRPRNL